MKMEMVIVWYLACIPFIFVAGCVCAARDREWASFFVFLFGATYAWIAAYGLFASMPS